MRWGGVLCSEALDDAVRFERRDADVQHPEEREEERRRHLVLVRPACTCGALVLSRPVTSQQRINR